ncbi:ParB/RepB/Spo0J family partition protein [Ohessyouella blattaphilus]|uniref:ParB/RepB/Spo0J family partition protein n=1 Tax=Ohessyouella blattaphilus TaxID=2949333 RepID=A0ABT1EJP7_9FIRM|nr:ParB/RepB/Spo0J family partition protein [Ohessyouella blattaphilus]MCP1110918.1 ParB/RepB/Spo0J family partition protein [Ohessyouella blattaphilus]MCR8564312.1 ParB/RepB/Spo0J family partition protein [Ohessyouella blattaphilus]
MAEKEAKNKNDDSLGLPSFNDLFSSQEQRDDDKLSKIKDIPLELIDDFPKHPYKVKDDEDMLNLVESVKEHGVLTPATIRPKENGRFEIISGHRRKRACELAGFSSLRSEVVELDKDAATVLMVESNFQRTTILPSEKAFAYKMRLDAMKRQGKRVDLTCATVLHKLENKKSRQILAEQTGESHEQVRKYIRLTELIPELLNLVDEGQIALRPAVELSYLPMFRQQDLHQCIDIYQCTPSHAQALKMRSLSTEEKLTPEVINLIMSEEKPNQKEKLILRDERIAKLLPPALTASKREEYIIQALEHYAKHRARSSPDRER